MFGFKNTDQQLETIHANQLLMLRALQTIIKRMQAMAVDFTAFNAEMARQTTLNQSIIALLESVVTSNDQSTGDAIAALLTTFKANNDAIAAEVAKRVPASAPESV